MVTTRRATPTDASTGPGNPSAAVTRFLDVRTTIPSTPHGAMLRPRVGATLDAGTAGRLTVVTGGPGWGKTSAVAAWARDRPARPAWSTAEPEDNDPARFWSTLVSAIVGTGVPPENPLTRLTAIERVTPALLSTVRRGIAALPVPTVLVLDDFHVLTAPDVLGGLATLLDHDLPLRLVLVGRVDPVPPLPLHRLRLEGRLTEVTSRDLAFDPGEVVALGALHDVALDADDARRLLDRTEGWAAGVRLALLHLADQGSPRDLSEFAGSSRTVAEYLAAEMLDNQTLETRDMLLRTSVVRIVSPDLATWISGDPSAGRHLDALERAHLFVTSRGGRDRWYRYHPLLRQLLTYRLDRDDPEAVREAHRRAATWYLKNNRSPDAFRHAALARDWELTADVFVRGMAPHILGRDRQAIAQVLVSVPFADLDPTAALEVCRGALAVLDGRSGAAVERRAVEARRLLPRTPASVRPSASAGASLLELVVARAAGDHRRMVTVCTDALSQLGDGTAEAPTLDAYRAAFLGNQGIGLLWSGQTDEARRALEAARRTAASSGMNLTAVNALSSLALCAAISGRASEAADLSRDALDEAAALGVGARFQARGAHLAAAISALLRHRPEAALAGVAACEVSEPDLFPEPWIAALAPLVASRAESGRRRPRAARAALAAAALASIAPSDLRVDDDDGSSPVVEDMRLRAETDLALVGDLADEPGSASGDASAELATATALACRARLAAARHDDDAAARDARLGLGASPAADPPTTIECLLVLALVADRHRHDHEALSSLRRAVSIAAEHDVWLPFAVGVPADRLRALLHRLLDVAPESRAAVSDLLERLPGHAGDPRPVPLTEALTERELSVLMFLPTLQSNEEIAAQLFVSVNTVKTHLRGLYRKLGVGNRRAAAARAIALGLLRLDESA